MTFPWSASESAEYARAHSREVQVKGHWLSRFFIGLSVLFVRGFSIKGAWRFGKWMSYLMCALGIRRKTALINLDIVYGDQKTAKEKRAIYRASMINLGRQAVNYLRVPLYDERFWAENITIEGEEILRKAYSRGKGVIILSMHYGAWEIPGGKIGRAGYPIANIIKIMKNPVTEKLLIENRLAMNLGTIPHKNSMPRIKEGLARGEGIIMAIDQNMRPGRGVFVDWFGRPASTVRSTAYVARETGAAVVAGYSRQPAHDRIEVIVLGEIPWEPLPDDPDQELLLNTRNYIAPFEKPIFDEPEQWLWAHRRWKVQPDGLANPYI